jgi:hypothetical protein
MRRSVGGYSSERGMGDRGGCCTTTCDSDERSKISGLGSDGAYEVGVFQ